MSVLKRLLDIASFANRASQISLEEVAHSSEGEELQRLEPPDLIDAPPVDIEPALPPGLKT